MGRPRCPPSAGSPGAATSRSPRGPAAGGRRGRAAGRPGGIDVIVTSPLQRARQTAEAVAPATGAPLLVDEGLVETDFGKWEGLTFGEAAQRWPDEMSAWMGSADVAPPGGESFADVAQRRATPRWTGCWPRTSPHAAAGQPRHADQDRGLPGAARPARRPVPDPPGRRVAVRGRLVRRRPGRGPVAQRHRASEPVARPVAPYP